MSRGNESGDSTDSSGTTRSLRSCQLSDSASFQIFCSASSLVSSVAVLLVLVLVGCSPNDVRSGSWSQWPNIRGFFQLIRRERMATIRSVLLRDLRPRGHLLVFYNGDEWGHDRLLLLAQCTPSCWFVVTPHRDIYMEDFTEYRGIHRISSRGAVPANCYR